MASKTVYPTSKEVSCPMCGRTMLLKNWKDHCQTKHSMTLSEENLKKEYEKLKKTTTTMSSSSATTNDILSTNTLFSMKNFSLTKHSPTTSSLCSSSNNNNITVSSIDDHDDVNIYPTQNLDNIFITDVSSTAPEAILTIRAQSLNAESMIEMFASLHNKT